MTDRREDAAVRADLEASRTRLARLQDELSAVNEISTALLLDQPAVRDDLALTPEQTGRLAPLLDRLRAHQQAPAADAKGNRRRQIPELAAATRRDVEGVLTATQHRRLRQVLLQISGPHVFGPAVLDALGLTDAQRKGARAILSEATQASLRLVATAENREEDWTKFEEVWRQANGRIVETLTPIQRGRWTEMTGPPVRAGVRFPPPTSERKR